MQNSGWGGGFCKRAVLRKYSSNKSCVNGHRTGLFNRPFSNMATEYLLLGKVILIARKSLVQVVRTEKFKSIQLKLPEKLRSEIVHYLQTFV